VAGVQPAQIPPVFPHSSMTVPPTQVPDVPPSSNWQHPPAHGTAAEQAVSHVCVPALQTTFVGQSVLAVVHPHVPPLAPATHLFPTLAPAHAWQAPPLSPQAVTRSPVWQTPSVPPSAPSQQPPLQSCVDEHAVVQLCVVALHASPLGQSLATLQPQTPVVVMHCAPASPATQLLHIVPGAPQAVAVSGAAHVVPLQQVPLQGCVELHVAVQVWEPRSQASP
jgi:hypothetical protein